MSRRFLTPWFDDPSVGQTDSLFWVWCFFGVLVLLALFGPFLLFR